MLSTAVSAILPVRQLRFVPNREGNKGSTVVDPPVGVYVFVCMCVCVFSLALPCLVLLCLAVMSVLCFGLDWFASSVGEII